MQTPAVISFSSVSSSFPMALIFYTRTVRVCSLVAVSNYFVYFLSAELPAHLSQPAGSLQIMDPVTLERPRALKTSRLEK